MRRERQGCISASAGCVRKMVPRFLYRNAILVNTHSELRATAITRAD